MANGTLYWRVQAIEKRLEKMDQKLDSFREEYQTGRQGMTTAEKLMLLGIVASAFFAILGVMVALGVFTS